jgi:hypothetical protein
VSTTATATSDAATGLAKAPVHVKLAVELIMLLEQQQLADTDIMAALEIVVTDYRRKCNMTQKLT